jgi:probable rRNA maturation factor
MSIHLTGKEYLSPSDWRQLLKAVSAIERGMALGPVDFTVGFIGDTEMMALNCDYRGLNKTTDVLSFPNDYEFGVQSPLDEEESEYLGDIAISIDVAIRQCGELGHSLIDELAVLIIHGFVHLLGIDHERSPKEARFQAECEMTLLAGSGRDHHKALCGRILI